MLHCPHNDSQGFWSSYVLLVLLVAKKPIKDNARTGGKDKRWSPSFDPGSVHEPGHATCLCELHFPHLTIEEVGQGMCGVPSTSRIQWVYECIDFFFLWCGSVRPFGEQQLKNLSFQLPVKDIWGLERQTNLRVKRMGSVSALYQVILSNTNSLSEPPILLKSPSNNPYFTEPSCELNEIMYARVLVT